MKVTVEQISRLFDKHGDSIEVKYFDDVIVRGSAYLSTDLVLPAHISRLKESNVSEIEVFYTANLYELLSKEFPVEFRKPFNRLHLTDMDRLLENIRDANAQSKRKRFVRLVGDVYGVDKALGKRVILIKHNEPLDFKKWNNLKREFERGQVFPFRNSEVAILIFVDLKVARQKEYVERFKINTDLISMIVTRSQDTANIISPDFIPTEDVVSVTEPGVLLEEYIRSNARLIIIGEKLDDSCKRALLQVRNYDKFVRLLVVPALYQNDIHDFFHQVKVVYNTDRWL
ncbi:MAG: hypothetical protein JW807_15815 [Spirochaetes bacterium]|nr:hypothetical protein [Spirochaetota bacterium]